MTLVPTARTFLYSMLGYPPPPSSAYDMNPDGAQGQDPPQHETLTIDDGETVPRGSRLKQRHVQMQVSNYATIAGTLGTGLFLGSGEAIRGAGPIGALIAYALVSTVAFASLSAVGEMTCFAPIIGTFPRYASRWVDPALGFAVGWNYFYTNAITVPVEISGAQLLIGYWDSNPDRQWIYILVLCLSTFLINIFGVRRFGEVEFVFGFIKLTMITVLILIGLVIDLGGAPKHDRLGFRYWKDPGPFARAGLVSNRDLDQFLGFFAAVVTESPRRNVAMAIRKTFYRILIFYLGGILIAGMIISSNDPDLLKPFSDSTLGNVTESPFVIAMRNASIKTMPSVVNAGLVTSAFSAANSHSFAASRVLEALAYKRQAPAIFEATYNDTPIAAVLFTCSFGLLSFMSLNDGAGTVFRWFVSLTTVGGFLSWATINLTYLYFYQGLKYRKIDRRTFIYWGVFQPWLSIWGLAMCIFFTLINGFWVFWDFKTEENDFFANYINVPIFLCLYAYWKVTKNTSFRRVEDRDFTKDIPSIEETETEYIRPHGFWERVSDVVF
ncbi:general APC amino acid permease [Paxillus ammoniavirescens]|nr:general APC amino acid permease [Paxillus ammoniavirescens]